MTRSFPLIVGSALSILAAGCSALGLDRFDFPDCESGCNELNVRDGITVDATTCLAWRCDMSSGNCRFGAPDRDQDGHYSLVCEGVEGVSPADDCNDADPAILPGGSERCNGEDDNCDGLVDETYTTPPSDPPVVLATTGDPAWLRAYDRPEGGVAIAYGIGHDGAGFEVITSGTTTISAGDALAPAAPLNPGRDVFNQNGELAHGLGCVGANVMRTSVVPCTDAADCPAPQPVCGGAFCEAAISFPAGYPTDDSVCHTSGDCDDGSFCNGIPQCEPTLDPAAMDPLVDARHCRPPTNPSYACAPETRCEEDLFGCTLFSRGGCELAHAAIAPTHEGEWFAPFVSTSPCGVGTVRFGYFDDDPSHTDANRYPQRAILQRGDSRRSTAYLGVDAVSAVGGHTCTGATRDAAMPRGASGLVAASVPRSAARHRPEALVAFVAAPFCREHPDRDRCPAGTPGLTGPADVEVIGAWFEEGTTAPSAAPIAWVNATGDGVPTRLGVQTTATARRPALEEYVSGEDAGWVLAYPRDGGGVSFHVIPAFEDPSPACVEPPAGEAMVYPCLEGRSGRTYETRFKSPTRNDPDRTTAPLVVPMAQHAFEDATMITGDAALALADPVDGTVRIAVAWMEETEIALATATLTIATGTIAPDATVTRFPHDTARELALVYVPGGLRAEDGAGFVLTWVGADGTWGARMLLDGTVLEPGHVRLGRPSDHPRAFVEMVDHGDGLPPTPVVRVLGHNAASDGFVAFPGVCGGPS